MEAGIWVLALKASGSCYVSSCVDVFVAVAVASAAAAVVGGAITGPNEAPGDGGRRTSLESAAAFAAVVAIILSFVEADAAVGRRGRAEGVVYRIIYNLSHRVGGARGLLGHRPI